MRVYPIVYFDAMFVKVREDRSVRSRACYLAIGVDLSTATARCSGIWWQETEGAKFWLAVLNDLHRRGVEDVLIACVDGLKGFPEAIEAVFPQAWVQTCIVHQIRASLRYVNYRDRKQGRRRRCGRSTPPPTPTPRWPSSSASTHEWGERYPMIVNAWRERWEHVIPFLALPAELRRAVYTTNTHREPHRQIRKAIKTRGHFPDEQAATKLIYLAIHQSRRQVAAQPHLDRAPRSPQDPLRRPIPRLTINPVASASTHRRSDTLPAGDIRRIRAFGSPRRDRR